MIETARTPAAQLPIAPLFGAAVDLLHQGGQHAEQGDDEAANSEEERSRLPERAAGRERRLHASRGHRHHKGDRRKEQQGSGQDVKIPRHGWFQCRTGKGESQRPRRGWAVLPCEMFVSDGR